LPEEFKKAFKPVFDVMDKHGLTDKVLKDFKANQLDLTMKMPEKTRLGLRKLIKKPVALMIDLTTAQEKAQKNGGLPFAQQGKPKTSLKDLKVTGNKATGTIVVDYNGFESKQSVEFVKLNVGWKMVPSLEVVAVGGGAPPPPVEKQEQAEKIKRR
jgi:hypothetical protein